MSFDFAPILTGETLRLRPLEAADFDALHRAASAPETWAGHPATDRHTIEKFRPYVDFLLAAGGTLAVEDRAKAQLIGASRFYVAEDAPEDVAIGFTFLDHAYWGGAWNFAMITLMLDHAFAQVPRVWLHIAPSNIRSQKATAKLGALYRGDATLDLAGTPALWQRYCLTRSDWAATKAARLSVQI